MWILFCRTDIQCCCHGSSSVQSSPVNMEKSYNHVPKGLLLGVLQMFKVQGMLLNSILEKSKIKLFLSAGWTLDMISRCSHGEENVRFLNLIFAFCR